MAGSCSETISHLQHTDAYAVALLGASACVLAACKFGPIVSALACAFVSHWPMHPAFALVLCLSFFAFQIIHVVHPAFALCSAFHFAFRLCLLFASCLLYNLTIYYFIILCLLIIFVYAAHAQHCDCVAC